MVESIDLRLLADRLAQLEKSAEQGDDILEDLRKLGDFSFDDPALQAIDESEISPRLAWLPFSLSEALELLGLTRIVNKRLLQGYYRDRLIVLVTQEKSSSTLHEVALLQMLRYSGQQMTIIPLPRTLKCAPLSMAGQSSFHFGLLLYFPNGGVCRGEFSPNSQNHWMISRFLQCRAVILTRHPADRLVAQFCMRQERFRAPDQETVFNQLFLDVDLPGNIGSLQSNLDWLAGWVRHGSGERTLIVKYEDMMEGAIDHFEKSHEFLYKQPMSAELIAEIENAFSRSGEGGDMQPGDKTKRTYPKGYSGKAGVWRDYLTSANVENYNRVVGRFLDYSEQADALLDLYPDLLLELEVPK